MANASGATDLGELPAPSIDGAATTPAKSPNAAAAVVAYVFASGLALLMPYFLLSGGEVMGLIIIAIGLWEAWQRSAPRIEDQIAGPFQINPAA